MHSCFSYYRIIQEALNQADNYTAKYILISTAFLHLFFKLTAAYRFLSPSPTSMELLKEPEGLLLVQLPLSFRLSHRYTFLSPF